MMDGLDGLSAEFWDQARAESRKRLGLDDALPRAKSHYSDRKGIDDNPTPQWEGAVRDMGPGREVARPAGAFALIRACDMVFKEPEFLIEDLLETDTMALAFGDPGCGKSFLAVDIACCIATGISFHGREIKRGAVIYLAGEGHNGLKRRLTAWERHNRKCTDDAPLFFSKTAASFLDGKSALAVARAVDAIATIEGAPALIIVDTLARNFGAGDENQTNDMNQFVAALDDLRGRYPGCTVLIIHHTGHSDKQRGRGAMSLKAALDAEYRIEKVADEVTMTCDKMKDAPLPAPVNFALMSVEMGSSERGKPITSGVLVLSDGAGRPTRSIVPAPVKAGLSAFNVAKTRLGLAGDLSAGIDLEDWRAAFYEKSTADSLDTKRKAFNRARQACVDAGALSVSNDIYRLARVEA